MSQLTTLPVASIAPDPNQPRKYFDESAMSELTESVKANGILQPILVRTWSAGSLGDSIGSFLLVCGERRLRAAKEAGLTEIPAVIRELTDDEALEVQIVENLQRKDVNPMEEAVAFKSLADRFEVEEIAAKVGKSVSYVVQRLSLNNLIPEFQELLHAGKIALVDAYKVARTFEATQKEMASEFIPKGWKNSPSYNFVLGWRFKEAKRELAEAPFDLNDADLLPSAGACSSCQYNSAANTNLFPDLAHKAECHNPSCYSIKKDKAFKVIIESAASDPDMVLIDNSYGTLNKEEKAQMALAKSLGAVPVKLEYSQMILMPDQVTSWESYLKDAEEDEESELEEMDDKERKSWETSLKRTWEADVKFYKEAMERYNDPSLKKGFIVVGSNEGTFVKVKAKAKSSAKASSSSTTGTAGPSEADSIDAEIEGIKSREKRSKELDGEKVVVAVTKMLGERKVAISGAVSEFDRRELMLFIFGLCKQNSEVHDHCRKKLKVGEYNDPKLLQALLKDEGKTISLNVIGRVLILSTLCRGTYNNPEKDAPAMAALHFADIHLPTELKHIQEEQAAKAEKRSTAAENRIKALRKKKAELKPVALKKIKK